MVTNLTAGNQGGTHPIGVLIGDLSFDFTSELMAGISDAATDAGAQVMFLLGMQKHSAPTDRENGLSGATSNNSVYDYSALIGADAFIIACGSLTGFSGDGLYKQFLDRFKHLPYVVLQERIKIDTPQKTYIVVDNYQSYSQCIEHLIVEHGYRNIAFVSGPEGHADARERRRAYLDCMQRHGLPVAPGMIVYGDFYEYADEMVSALLDQNPGLQAIAFANDEMAKAGYRECRRRGLVVGRDIAITGFDNFSAGRTMEPPLTTVSQDTYKMGRTALEAAITLLRGEKVPPMEMKTEFLKRQSCGCQRARLCLSMGGEADESRKLIDAAIVGILEGYASSFAQDERGRYVEALGRCLAHLRQIALETPDEMLDFTALATYLADCMDRDKPPMLLLSQSLEEFMLQLLCGQRLTMEVKRFAATISFLQQYIHTREVYQLKEQFDTYRTQSWIAPELTRGLFNQTSEESAFRCVVDRLMAAGLRQVYISLLDSPQHYGRGGLAVIPKKLSLAAYATAKDTVVYPRDKMPVIDARHPVRSLPGFSQIHSMMAFSIFSGENQYGMLLCEADTSKSTLLQVIGLQLGMLFDFLELRHQEKTISDELENIREKNEILNFLSEYDPLCGLLNRRGLIERAIRLNRENIGKTAFCAFIDLDYLKQINDTYGHSEGDFALQGVSGILKGITAESDLVGRIGGDEFVCMFLTDDPWFEEHLTVRIRRECERYNDASGKPYLLDVSVGIARFICRQGMEVSGIIAEADKYLYEAKRRRTVTSLRRNTAGLLETAKAAGTE